MEKTPATMMKEFVNSQKFGSTTEVMVAMKANDNRRSSADGFAVK